MSAFAAPLTADGAVLWVKDPGAESNSTRKRIDHAVKKSMKSRFFCGVFFCFSQIFFWHFILPRQHEMNLNTCACWTCFPCCSVDSEGHSWGVLHEPCMCCVHTNLSVLGHSQACCVRHAHVAHECFDPFPFSCQTIPIKKTLLRFLRNFTAG